MNGTHSIDPDGLIIHSFFAHLITYLSFHYNISTEYELNYSIFYYLLVIVIVKAISSQMVIVPSSITFLQ